MLSIEILHDAENQRFTAQVEGCLCVLDYDLSGSVMTITHTGVPEKVGGRGIAAALTKRALETAAVARWKVIPACSYAAAYLRRHHEYEPLRFRN